MWSTTIRSLFEPKGAPALFEPGLDSEGGDTRQLNNAEQTGADAYPLKVSSLCYSDFFIPVFKTADSQSAVAAC